MPRLVEDCSPSDSVEDMPKRGNAATQHRRTSGAWLRLAYAMPGMPGAIARPRRGIAATPALCVIVKKIVDTICTYGIIVLSQEVNQQQREHDAMAHTTQQDDKLAIKQQAEKLFNDAQNLLWQNGDAMPFLHWLSGVYGLMQDRLTAWDIEYLKARIDAGRPCGAAEVPHKRT